MDISDTAFNFIVEQEDSGEAYYARHYTHFEWPQGASGPTVGIGYDCGYVSIDECKQDWDGILEEDQIAVLVRACGLRAGAAYCFVRDHGGSVTIPWDAAITQFRTRELPKWIERVNSSLPNCDQLSADSLGAVVSLAYNRGASFGLPGPRFSEMRAIKLYMTLQEFDRIPGEFLSMRRLWPRNGGLWNRRTKEAELFRQGLVAKMAA